MTVEFYKVNSANVSAQNTSSDTYHITADVQLGNGSVSHIDAGEVKLEGTLLATFSYWSENRLNVNYFNVDVDTQNYINTEVNAFVAAAMEAAATSSINL